MKNSSLERGQVAVSILLTMVVLMTIGLSVATQTTQELLISQQDTESTRVLHVAESTAEEALSEDFTTYTDIDTAISNLDPAIDAQTVDAVDAEYSITARDELDTYLLEGEVATVYLNTYSSGYSSHSDTLTINWGQFGQEASLIVAVYTRVDSTEDTDYTVRYYPLNQGNDAAGHGNRFIPVTTTGDQITPGGDSFNYKYTLDYQEEDMFVRITAAYADTPVRVVGTNLPQQHEISALAANTRNQGTDRQEVRNIMVNRTLAAPPHFMDYALYSGGSLSK